MPPQLHRTLVRAAEGESGAVSQPISLDVGNTSGMDPDVQMRSEKR
jgi:hypothetical protein